MFQNKIATRQRNPLELTGNIALGFIAGQKLKVGTLVYINKSDGKVYPLTEMDMENQYYIGMVRVDADTDTPTSVSLNIKSVVVGICNGGLPVGSLLVVSGYNDTEGMTVYTEEGSATKPHVGICLENLQGNLIKVGLLYAPQNLD